MYQCPLCHRHPCKTPVCVFCQDLLKPLIRQGHFCHHCGRSILPGTTLCGPCIKKSAFIDFFWTSFYYEPPLSLLIQKWKFHYQLSLSQSLSFLMLSTPPPWLKKAAVEAVLPMPTTVQSYKKRLFNQSSELSYPIACHYGFKHLSENFIEKNNKSLQHHLTKTERLKNINGAFTLLELPREKHLLLIDDVVTTGATIQELARNLKKKNPNCQISAWILAQKETPYEPHHFI